MSLCIYTHKTRSVLNYEVFYLQKKPVVSCEKGAAGNVSSEDDTQIIYMNKLQQRESLISEALR